MTWLKLSDDFHDDCAGLSDAAYRTHVEALGWVMRRETGGYLSPRDVRRCLETADPDAAVEELVDAGFWQREGEGYRVLHHMRHQPDPEVIQRRREKYIERQRKHRRRQAGLQPDPEQSRRDTTRDTTRDPGRAGPGRDGTGREQPEGRPPEPANASCTSCGGEGCSWCGETGQDPLGETDSAEASG